MKSKVVITKDQDIATLVKLKKEVTKEWKVS